MNEEVKYYFEKINIILNDFRFDPIKVNLIKNEGVYKIIVSLDNYYYYQELIDVMRMPSLIKYLRPKDFARDMVSKMIYYKEEQGHYNI